MSTLVVALAVCVMAPGPPLTDKPLPGEPGSGLMERLLDQQGQGRGGGQQAKPGAAPKQARGGGAARQQAKPQGGGGQKQPPAQNVARKNTPQRGGAQEQAKAQRGKSAQAAQSNKAQQKRVQPEQARGAQTARRDVASVQRGRGRMTREDVIRQVRALPSEVRALERSSRMSDRLLVGAVARGVARGMRADEVRFERADDRLRVFNRDDDLLFDMDEQRARALGGWDMRLLGDQRPRGNGPAFCRSGAGHPVWGRQWCLDKGFGLGSSDRWIWSRRDVDDIVFYRRVADRDRLMRDVLIDVLGDVVFGRLALHALTLGFTEPLVGTWVAEPQAPRLLLINSGDYAVAELVDVDYDDRVDVLFVTQPW